MINDITDMLRRACTISVVGVQGRFTIHDSVKHIPSRVVRIGVR